jgi:hypothetical protein
LNINLLLRGQSNAFWLAEAEGGAGARKLIAEAERLLGFDGVNDRLNLVYERVNEGAATVRGNTALIGDWLEPDGTSWRIGEGERGLLNAVAGLPQEQRDDPTIVLWLHSEYDSRDPFLTAARWESAVRFEAATLREALGQSAENTPYVFVSAHPYWGDNQAHQEIRVAMEGLAADPAFNARVGARALDVDLDRDNTDGNIVTRDFGGPHISDADALLIAGRLARAMAEEFAAYAKPGSPLAVAGGQLDDQGPQVVAAEQVAANQLLLTVRFDQATTLVVPDAVAAAGIGWSVRGATGTVEGRSVELAGPGRLLVSFDGALPAGGELFYGWGYGRLAAPDGSGRGHAVYDDQGVPIWVQADGLAIGAGAPEMARTVSDDFMTVTSNGHTSYARPDIYNGPVTWLQYQLIGTAQADVVIGTSKNDFINLVGADDAANCGAGDDVVDGGVGSNFLTGGTGHDIFFVDGRVGTTTWSTITDWEVGEQLSVWGWRSGVSTVAWLGDAGAPGWTGLTMHSDLNGDGTIDTSVTWTGLTRDQLPLPREHDGLLWFA